MVLLAESCSDGSLIEPMPTQSPVEIVAGVRGDGQPESQLNCVFPEKRKNLLGRCEIREAKDVVSMQDKPAQVMRTSSGGFSTPPLEISGLGVHLHPSGTGFLALPFYGSCRGHSY